MLVLDNVIPSWHNIFVTVTAIYGHTCISTLLNTTIKILVVFIDSRERSALLHE